MVKRNLRYELILIALLSIAVLLVGCGSQVEDAEETANEPDLTQEAVTEEVTSNVAENDGIALTFTEGWEVVESRGSGSQIVLEKADSEEFFKPELNFQHSAYSSPIAQIELWENVYKDGSRIDNVTIGGIEYLVFSRDAAETGPYIYLSTSPGEEFNEDGEGYLTIQIGHTEIADVTPILETITFKPLQ